MTWLVLAAALLAPLLWWYSRSPSHERDWLPEVARLPTAEVRGDRVTVKNVRNFRYRTTTDFDERWETREYDLAKLDGLDMFFSDWGAPGVVHTILSWSFAGGQHLAVSVEARKRKGQRYSALKAFFRTYELAYVAGDERDVIHLRTNVRRERVRLYRLTTRPDAARRLLLAYLEDMNELARKPRWYSALLANCTTSIRQRVLHAGGKLPFSWKQLANARLDEWLYERGTLDASRPFAELRAASGINERALAGGVEGDFSRRIRAASPPAR